MQLELFVQYDLAPNAIYHNWLDVRFVSGSLQVFAETPGVGNHSAYNGVLGAAFDKTEDYLFLSTAEGKKIRKLNIATTAVGSDVTRKFILLNAH
jgi:hypothetical protein